MNLLTSKHKKNNIFNKMFEVIEIVYISDKIVDTLP